MFGLFRKASTTASNVEDRYSRHPLSPFWYQTRPGRKTHAKIDVNDDSARTYSAVWAATSLISNSIASLPRHTKRLLPNGDAIVDTTHVVNGVWGSSPNAYMSGFTYHDMMLASMINWGYALAYVRRTSAGQVYEASPIHPSRCPAENIRLVNADTGAFEYDVIEIDDRGKPSGKTTTYTDEEVVRFVGKHSIDGITGCGVISYAAETIGIGIAADHYAGTYYGSEVASNLYVSTDSSLSEKQYERIKGQFRDKRGVRNLKEPLVIEAGGKLVTLDLPLEQTQLLESRKYNIKDIARWYNVPVRLLRESDKMSVANIESEMADLVQISFMPWITLYTEQSKNNYIGRKRGRIFFDIDTSEFLRGNSEARSNYYKSLYSIGGVTINEVRRKEGLNGIGTKGDKHFVPVNFMELEAALETQQKAAESAGEPEPIEEQDDAGQESPNSRVDPPEDNTPDVPTEGSENMDKLKRYNQKVKRIEEELVDMEHSRLRRLAVQCGPHSPTGKHNIMDEVRNFYHSDFTVKAQALILGLAQERADLDQPYASAHEIIFQHIQTRFKELDSAYDYPLSEIETAVGTAIANFSPSRIAEVLFAAE